jgi:tripartite-type tricarboxylate transporter receptor subunit TctC
VKLSIGFVVRFALMCVLSVVAFSAAACTRQEGPFPSREIRLIVHAAPGGISDGVSRYLARELQEELRMPVIVENRVGGGGAVAFSYVAGSKADGYTIGYAPVDLAIVPHLGYARVSPADFDPLVMHTRASAALAVRSDARWKTLEEFVETARAKRLGINLATAGPGSLWQIGSIELSRRIGTEFNYVPFPGSGPSITALLGGHVDAVVAGVSEVRNQVRAGNLRLLGVMAPERTPLFPDVPTFRERGYDLVFQAWGGLMLPKGTPVDRRDVLAKALLKVIQGDVFQRFCRDAGIEVATKGPEEFTQFVSAEFQGFGPIVKTAGLGISGR